MLGNALAKSRALISFWFTEIPVPLPISLPLPLRPFAPPLPLGCFRTVGTTVRPRLRAVEQVVQAVGPAHLRSWKMLQCSKIRSGAPLVMKKSLCILSLVRK